MNTYTLVNGALYNKGAFLCNVSDKHKTVESALKWYLAPVNYCDDVDYEQQELDILQGDY